MSRISAAVTGGSLAVLVAGLLMAVAGFAGLEAGPVLILLLAGSICLFAIVRVAVLDRDGATGPMRLGGEPVLARWAADFRPTRLDPGPLTVSDRYFWISLGGLVLTLLVVVVLSGLSPGELQTVGGVLGILAIVNYILRPVYVVLYVVTSMAIDAARATRT